MFSNPVLEEQAQLIQQAQKKAYTTIPVVSVQSRYPLSSSQRRLWVLSQFEGSNVAYNVPGVYLLEGELNIEALKYSFESLIERHENLRTVFKEDSEGDVYQGILTGGDSGFRIDYKDLRGEASGDSMAKELSLAEISQPFDLSRGPLLRAGLYQLLEHKWVFSYVIHHIISDGWSMEVLIKELFILQLLYKRGVSWSCSFAYPV